MNRVDTLNGRMESFRGKMDTAGINLAIIVRPVDIYHFSDFNPINYSMQSFVLIPRFGEPCLLLNAVRGPRSDELSGMRNIKLYGKWSDNPSVAKSPIDAIKIIAESYKLGKLRIGSELSSLIHTNYLKIADALCVEEITDITEVMDLEKLVKDDMAIERLTNCADVCNHGMNIMIECLRGGSTEAVATIEANYAMKKKWISEYPQYDITGFGSTEASIQDALMTTCSSGIRTAYGAESARDYKPISGDLVLPIIIGKMGGYSVENERSLYVDQLDDYRMKVFEIVMEARNSVFNMIRPDVTFSDLYHSAASIFEKQGFGDFMPARIGHGMGLTNHEYPSVEAGNMRKLEPGMVFTVEPGLMSSKFGGVRPSDTVLITKDGFKNLTNTENGILRI